MKPDWGGKGIVDSAKILEVAREAVTREALVLRGHLQAFVAAGFTREEAVTLCAARIKASVEVRGFLALSGNLGRARGE